MERNDTVRLQSVCLRTQVLTDDYTLDIKGRAFLENSFDEFLYIDSDNIPLQNPSQYFDSVEYKEQGSVFWPDLYKDHGGSIDRRGSVGPTYIPNAQRPIPSGASSASLVKETGRKRRAKLSSIGAGIPAGTKPYCCSQIACKPRASFGITTVWGTRTPGDTPSRSWVYRSHTMGGRSRLSEVSRVIMVKGKPSFADTVCFRLVLSWVQRKRYTLITPSIQWGLTPPASRHDGQYHPEPGFAHANMASHDERVYLSTSFLSFRTIAKVPR